MQVSEVQVQRSLRALTGTGSEGATEGPAESAAEGSTVPPSASGDPCPEGLVAALAAAPAVRDDRIAEARRRLEQGEEPSPEALAQRMVGRLVCDRLR